VQRRRAYGGATAVNQADAHTIAVLSREEALELVYQLLLHGQIDEAMNVSLLIASAPHGALHEELAVNLELELKKRVVRRDYRGGLDVFRARSETDLITPEIERLVGVCYGQTGNYLEGRYHLLRAKAAGSLRASLDSALLEFQSQNFSISVQILNEALARQDLNDLERLELEDQLGTVYQAIGELELARNHFERVSQRLEVIPEFASRLARTLRRITTLEFSLARFQEALRRAEQGLRLCTDIDVRYPLLIYRALSMALLNRRLDANEDLTQLADVDKLEPTARITLETGLGALGWLRGDRHNALHHYFRAAQIARQFHLRRQISTMAWQLVVLYHQLGQFEEMTQWRSELEGMLEGGARESRFERVFAFVNGFVQLVQERFELALQTLEPLIPDFESHHMPGEAVMARLMIAEAHLALGQVERGRRSLIEVIDWWERHARTPLILATLGSLARVAGFVRTSGDPALSLLYKDFAARFGPLKNAISFVTLTSEPSLLIGERAIPLANRHVLPLLVYLWGRGKRGASVADIGRDLYPELRGEALRNRVKNARIHWREICAELQRTAPEAFTSLNDIQFTSEGNNRSMTLSLETGSHLVQWDLEELDKSLDTDTGDWIWRLNTYNGAFLQGYELEGDEAWVAATNMRLNSKLLERSAQVVKQWFEAGRLEPLRALVVSLLERGILDPAHPLTDVIAAFDVRAAGTLYGFEVALAAWVSHETRFRSAYVECPILESVQPKRWK
jgi:tetratricopeptide (TPR) repeat protein